MVRIAVHDRFQHPDDFGRMAFRFGAAGLPVIPRRQVHQRFAVRTAISVVVGIALGDIHHGIGIGAVQRPAVGGGIGCVALGQGFDQRLFVGPCVAANSMARIAAAMAGAAARLPSAR